MPCPDFVWECKKSSDLVSVAGKVTRFGSVRSMIMQGTSERVFPLHQISSDLSSTTGQMEDRETKIHV